MTGPLVSIYLDMPLWRRTNAGDEECNRAVLVSESNFDHGVPLGRRPGAEKDTKRLHGALARLGYRVDIHMDLNAQEIYTLFKTGNTHLIHTPLLQISSKTIINTL